MRELKLIKQKYRDQIELSIAIGGWTQSVYFSNMTSTEKNMDNYINTFVSYFIQGNTPQEDANDKTREGWGANVYTSISIDWEFPGWKGNGNTYSPNDGFRLTRFLQKLRQAAQKVVSANKLKIGVAISGDPAKMALDYFAHQVGNDANPQFDMFRV